jgi:DNA-binding Lrp family transcriptional regulator
MPGADTMSTTVSAATASFDPIAIVNKVAGALSGTNRKRTNQPVRRNSHNAGGTELGLWRTHNMFPKTEHNARMRAAEELEHETKLPGKRNGAIGAIGLKVYRYLLRLRGKKNGRLDPTIRFIADQVRHSRSAVAAALKRLKDAGFLDWIRRCQPIENAEPDEQQTEQIANAYFITTPAMAKEHVRRMLRRPSEFVRAVADKVLRQRKVDTTEVVDIIAEVRDPALRAMLDRARAAVDSANPSSGQTEAL